MNDFSYVGSELELFARATRWKSYFGRRLRPYLGAAVLEVGCTSGFIAKGLAPRVKRYTGIDLAESARRVAQRLSLQNTDFRQADGKQVPFPDTSFVAAYCYDVFTNFPAFDESPAIGRICFYDGAKDKEKRSSRVLWC